MLTVPISPVTRVAATHENITSPQTGVVSLETRLIDAIANSAVSSEINKDSVLNDMENRVNMTPEKLIEVQDKVLNYNIEISLVSTVARKAVGAVETLLRA